MIPRAVIRVSYAHVEDYLCMGWMPHIPTQVDYMHFYGIYMYWLCECSIPTRRKDSHDEQQEP